MESGCRAEEGATCVAQAKVIKGDLVRLDYGDCLIKEKDGQEIRLHIGKKTQMMGQRKEGRGIRAIARELSMGNCTVQRIGAA